MCHNLHETYTQLQYVKHLHVPTLSSKEAAANQGRESDHVSKANGWENSDIYGKRTKDNQFVKLFS